MTIGRARRALNAFAEGFERGVKLAGVRRDYEQLQKELETVEQQSEAVNRDLEAFSASIVAAEKEAAERGMTDCLEFVAVIEPQRAKLKELQAKRAKLFMVRNALRVRIKGYGDHPVVKEANSYGR